MSRINRQHNNMIRAVIYQLKKQYGGGPLDVYKVTSSAVNITSGVKTVTKTKSQIRTVVCLPAKVERTFVQSISKISADKQFVYGGTYDRSRRMFLIDRRDAPDLTLTLDDWLVYNGIKYEVKVFDAFEFLSLWVVIGNQVLGDLPEQFIDCKVDDLLGFTETIDVE